MITLILCSVSLVLGLTFGFLLGSLAGWASGYDNALQDNKNGDKQ
jgi:ABC-type dipeptide/oligopeptide/nickel transport system permease subunit